MARIRPLHFFFALALASATLALAPPRASAQAPRSPTPDAVPFPGRVTVVAQDLSHPWGMALLPDGSFLVTEKEGRLRSVAADGTLSEPLAGVPEVEDAGQGGLLDVALSPRFAEDRWVFLSFSEPGEEGVGTALARGRLSQDGVALEDVQVIWRQQPKVSGPNHFGSRLLFARDGTLFVTLGDRYAYKEKAQDLGTTLGKIVRVTVDGRVPPSNPFVDRSGALPEIWSLGHRNVQAAALRPDTDRLYTVEHGAQGGDELNHPEPGRNYGWPVITYGVDYGGGKIGEGTARPGMEQPLYWWDPVIAPSGAIFYAGDAFPDWRGDLLVGSLKPGGLVRLVLDGERVVREERYRGEGELDARIRDVLETPDGRIYLLTDADDGKLLRLEPAAAAR